MAKTPKCPRAVEPHMLERLRQRSVTEPIEETTTVGAETEPPDSRATFFRLGRVIYGGILAIMAIDGLRGAEERAQYAAAKGVPMPKLANAVAHGLLLGGGAGIALWRAPALAASAVAGFFLGVTPAIHDFWAEDDPDQHQQQVVQFLKNSALFGTALLVIGVARREN